MGDLLADRARGASAFDCCLYFITSTLKRSCAPGYISEAPVLQVVPGHRRSIHQWDDERVTTPPTAGWRRCSRAGAGEGGSGPWPRRMALAAALEMRLLAPLAAPAVAVYMLAMVVHADILRPPRQRPARRRLPRQQRHPALRLRPHGTRTHIQ
jgi:hypothetical protein